MYYIIINGFIKINKNIYFVKTLENLTEWQLNVWNIVEKTRQQMAPVKKVPNINISS